MARKYQAKQNESALPDSLVPTLDGAQEYNSPRDEIKNAAESSGQLLAEQDGIYQPSTNVEDRYQLAKAMFRYSLSSSSFTDGSAVPNLYEVTPTVDILKFPLDLSGNPTFDKYSLLAGATISFIPNSTNTGDSQLNIGQNGTWLGLKDILTDEDPPQQLAPGALSEFARYSLLYDPTILPDGAWRLVNRFSIDPAIAYKYIRITRQYASGTAGGAYLDNPPYTPYWPWVVIDLNNLALDETGQVVFEGIKPHFSLAPGRYRIEVSDATQDLGATRVGLYKDAAPFPELILLSANGGADDGGQAKGDNYMTIMNDFFDVTDLADEYMLQLIGQGANIGESSLGTASNVDPEIYTNVLLTKIS